jgi:hypothetical protein
LGRQRAYSYDRTKYLSPSAEGFEWSRPPAPRTPLAAMNTTNTEN